MKNNSLYLNEGFTVEETEKLGCKADKIVDGVCYKGGERYDCPLKDECPVDFSTELGKKNYAKALLNRKLEDESHSKRVLTKKQLKILANHIGLEGYEHAENAREDTSIFAKSEGLVVVVRWHKELSDSTVFLFEHTEIERLVESLNKAKKLTSVEDLR